VPYHNYGHAFNIAHYVYIILRKTKIIETFLEDIDVLTLIVAAIGHDLNHPGVNNMYYTKTKHPIAQTVND